LLPILWLLKQVNATNLGRACENTLATRFFLF